jgi:hypothetical protein
MKRKYYNKTTVAYKFKHEILMDEKYADTTDDQKLILWEIFLLSLKDINKVSRHQANTWKYPTNLI